MPKATTAASTAFSTDFLAKIKTILTTDREKFQAELDRFNEKDLNSSDAANRFPDYGYSEEDNAQEVADFEANLSIEGDLVRSLRDVTGALERLEKGTYGICKYCHKAMDQKRLLARPTSSACVACKKTIVQEV